MSTPPPGWYPDPGMAQTQRYWDGTNWTAHVAPLPTSSAPVAAAQADYGPGTVEHWLLPVGRSGAGRAIFAIVAGLFAIVVGALTIQWYA